MIYANEIRKLLDSCGCEATIYTDRKPALPDNEGPVYPLTPAQRRRVERLSTERGYRRFTAEYICLL